MVSLTIDGQNVQVPAGTTILEAADTVGIKIPTLCWLQKVSPTGACRVCAVEVEGVDRTMTACNTPVKEGISVTTQSESLSVLRRKILELMLVNHPLDCPVCDAAGECDLQDSCVGQGATKQEYSAALERLPIRYDWTLLESDPNRCILCEKCVKVDHEVVGCDAIAVVNRGEAAIIDTVDGKPLNCEFCGNCIAACPTGTLISKPFKFRGRPWAFTVTKSVCAFCAAGCQIEYHSRNGRVERVTSDDSTYNSGNLCINGRFGYSYLNADGRLTTPLLKGSDGVQRPADWNGAMASLVAGLKKVPAGAVAGIGSARLTNEENYLFQKVLRGALGSNNIDSLARLGYGPVQEVLREALGVSGSSATMDRLDNAAAIFVLGCDLNAESTAMEYRVIKACTKKDAKLVLATVRRVKLSKYNHAGLSYRPGSELALVNGLCRVILDEKLENNAAIAAHGADLEALKGSLAGFGVAEAVAATGITETELREAARLLAAKPGLAIVFGADVIRGLAPLETTKALVNLAILTGAVAGDKGGIFPVDERTNVQGMLDMGIAPDYLPGYRPLPAGSAPGKDLWQMVQGMEEGSIKALYVLGTDLVATFPDRQRIKNALAKLELLVVQDIAATETAALAHIVLPGAAAAEKSGSFTTIDNRVQCLAKAVQPPGDAREDWDILVELYNRLAKVSSRQTPKEILAELVQESGLFSGGCTPTDGRCLGPVKQSTLKPSVAFASVATATAPLDGPVVLAGSILFHNGTMSTASANNLTVAAAPYVELSPGDAAALGVADGAAVRVATGSAAVVAPARVSDGLPAGMVFVPHHFPRMEVNALFTGAPLLATARLEKA
jgi:formate dehydrogenase alpha subunit